jgi:L-fuculokinase
MKKAVLILDVGATNLRAGAVSETGNIIAQKFFPNQTSPDPFYKDGLIWDVDNIWKKLSKATRFVINQINNTEIIGITVTTFGVDGAPFDNKGRQLYPVISWACPRTQTVTEDVHKILPLNYLYKTTGVYPFAFNTIYKLFWLNKHHKNLMSKMAHWLFMPSILSNRLTGTKHTDISMAGTSMLTQLNSRGFSEHIIHETGLKPQIFPPLKEAGQQVGFVTKAAAVQTGINEGTPVFATGHDTQFAVFGSGAGINEPVLSSGTWEILMVRTPNIKVNKQAFNAGITTEWDSLPGYFNPGLQWQGSAILEWIKKNFYTDIINNPSVYDIMINEAESVKNTAVYFNTNFLNNNGQILNLNTHTKRGEIYRAALTALAIHTKKSLQLIEEAAGFKAKSLTIVGGGSKNKLWNRIRSETLGIPVKTVLQTETTVLGAAMFVFGNTLYRSPEEAKQIFQKTTSSKKQAKR